MPKSTEPSEPVPTADGSFTFWHPGYREHYHSRDGARSEAACKFIAPSGLAERLRQGPVRLLDIGFGLGGNAFAALHCAEREAAQPLEVHSIENDAEALDRALRAAQSPEEKRWLTQVNAEGTLEHPHAHLTLHATDFRAIEALFEPQSFDLIFHDPFSPMKNPQGWSVELFALYRRLARPGAFLLTYSQAWAVRSGLQQSGWTVGETPGDRQHRGGTIASTDAWLIEAPVVIPAGVKAIPYRDPELSADALTILNTRQEEVRQWQRDHNCS